MNIALKTVNLQKKYGDITALDSISIEVLKGEIFGFLGPNGAGKTTSIKIMCGLLKPDSGTIFPEPRRGDGLIGLCPQDIAVWENLTCLEQLAYMAGMYGISPKKAKIKSLELLERMGLTAKANKMAKTLSGGMLRRLNIALALVHSPALVFLDEP